VDLSAYSVVPEAPDAVLSWLDGHPPAGSEKSGSGASGGPGFSISGENFSYPAVGVLDSRGLEVWALSWHSDETLIRVDVQDVYTPARPAAERIPKTVTRVEITATGPGGQVYRVSVTRADEVAAVVAAVNGLKRPDYTDNPGGPMLTLGMAREDAVLRFFVGDDHDAIAVAVDHPAIVIYGVGNIAFRIGNRSEPGLEDPAFVLAKMVEHLTGVHFVRF
jgi:hypothetical protein